MSLMVYPYLRNSNGEMLELNQKPRPPFNELFGFETWRSAVWASPSLKAMNCSILNALEHQDIYAEGENLHSLKRELSLVKDKIDLIINELGVNKESVMFRLDNGLEAVRIAIELKNGGVYIG